MIRNVLSNCCLGEYGYRLQKHTNNTKCIRDSLWGCHPFRFKVNHSVYESRDFSDFFYFAFRRQKSFVSHSNYSKNLKSFNQLMILCWLIYFYGLWKSIELKKKNNIVTLLNYTVTEQIPLIIYLMTVLKQRKEGMEWGESYLRDFLHQVISFSSLHKSPET